MTLTGGPLAPSGGYLWTHPNVQLLDGYPEATCDGVVRTEHACWAVPVGFSANRLPQSLENHAVGKTQSRRSRKPEISSFLSVLQCCY